MPRLLHTADWQLGLKLRGVTGDRGAEVRNARFRVVVAIAELAKAEAVDVVVVAGDVLDDNQLSPWAMQRTREVLRAFAPVPVLLLPGNHDCAEPGGALARLLPGQPGLEHVVVALSREPAELGGVTLFPCPLTQRRSVDDPTRELPPRAPGDDRVRVAVAHGGTRTFGQSETPNRIDVEATLARGFDYLALGDWHGLRREHARCWYPGAPEATRFKEQDPGHVLLVDLQRGAEPLVTPRRVAQTTWLSQEHDLRGDADLDAFEAALGGLPAPSATLVELRLRGALSPAQRARLDATLREAADTLLHLRLREDDVAVRPAQAELDAVDAPGFLGMALDALRARGDQAGDDALVLLLDLLRAEAAP